MHWRPQLKAGMICLTGVCGKTQEVSEAVFKYSLWHGRSVFVTHAIAIASLLLLRRPCGVEVTSEKLRYRNES
jgi:hypothetical protein